MIDLFMANSLFGIDRKISEFRHTINHICHEMIPVKIVKNNHIKKGGLRAFFFIASNVDVYIVGSPICQTMDQPGIRKKGKNGGFIRCKEGIEHLVGQAMRMLALRLKVHEIHHILHSNFQIGNLFAQKVHRSQCLKGGYITGAGHDHIGFSPFIVAGPIPNSDTSRTVLYGRIHLQILQRGLFAGHKDIDTISTSETFIRNE